MDINAHGEIGCLLSIFKKIYLKKIKKKNGRTLNNNAVGETGCNRWQSLNCTPVSVDISVEIRFLFLCAVMITEPQLSP